MGPLLMYAAIYFFPAIFYPGHRCGDRSLQVSLPGAEQCTLGASLSLIHLALPSLCNNVVAVLKM